MTLADNLRLAAERYHEKQRKEWIDSNKAYLSDLKNILHENLQAEADEGEYHYDHLLASGIDRKYIAWELARWCHDEGLALYLCDDLYEHYLSVPQDGNNPTKGIRKLGSGNHSFTISWRGDEQRWD